MNMADCSLAALALFRPCHPRCDPASRPPSPRIRRRSSLMRSFAGAIIVIALLLSLAMKILTMAMEKRRQGPSSSSSSSSMSSSFSEEERDAIEYVEVPSGEVGVSRYAARVRSSGSGPTTTTTTTTTKVSVRSWMTLVASSDSTNPGTTRAAREMSSTIASSTYSSLLFEIPGTTWRDSDDVPFEFVLVNAPALGHFVEGGGPDRDAFAEHFDDSSSSSSSSSSSCGGGVCSFANLGRDATLVSPVPLGDADDATYSHLARFVREAPERQVLEFWKKAASTYLDVLKRKDEDDGRDDEVGTWFSTNGMGVAWLHLRIDDRPKYYSYAPFKRLMKE